MPRRSHAHTEEEIQSRDLIAADVGSRIHQARIEAGMTLAELGGTELSRSFLSLVENGKSRISLGGLAIVAERLGKPISYFFTDNVTARAMAAEYQVNVAEAAVREGRAEEALRLLESAEVTEELRARALYIRGWAQSLLLRFGEGAETLQGALAASVATGDERLAADVHYRLGVALCELQRYDEAYPIFSRGVQHGLAVGDRTMAGGCRVMMGHIHSVRGEHGEALAQYEAARGLLESVSDPALLAGVYSDMAATRRQQGLLDDAVRYTRLALGIFEARDQQYSAALELNTIASTYEAMGELESARELAERAIERARSIGVAWVEALARTTLASILFSLGDSELALHEADSAEQLVGEDRDSVKAAAWVVQARVADSRGDSERTDALFRRALDVYDRLGQHPAYRRTAAVYRDILKRRGDLAGALDLYEAVEQRMQGGEMRSRGNLAEQ